MGTLLRPALGLKFLSSGALPGGGHARDEWFPGSFGPPKLVGGASRDFPCRPVRVGYQARRKPIR